MKAPPFDYHAPTTAPDAVALLAEYDGDAKVLAGGQSLLPLLALRMSDVGNLVDVGRIPGLSGIERRDDTVYVGGTATHSALGRSPVIAAVPLLARAVPLIGHGAIRNRGTVGGSVAHADPAAELPAVLLALEATVETLSPRGRRTLQAAEFFTGVWSTVLEPDELLTGLSFPVWTGRCGFAVEEFSRRHGDFAIAGAAVAIRVNGAGTVDRCAIALLGMGGTPLRATAAERSAIGGTPGGDTAEEVGRAAVQDLRHVPSDVHGTATYRTRIGAAMVTRAWCRASEEALHD